MIQEQLAFLPEFLPDYRPFPLPRNVLHGRGCPCGQGSAFCRRGKPRCNAHCAPAALALAGFHPHWAAHAWRTAYFSRRARLCALVCAECVEHEGRFLDEIADTVWALCEESAWQLPAHNSYIRDTPQLPLPDTTRPIVDYLPPRPARCWR